MAPIDFEKKIKELFEAQEIRPSGDAWDKVTSELGSPPAKSGLRPWHYWMAASLGFIVLLGWSVRKTSQPAVEEPPMVEQQINPERQHPQSAIPLIPQQTEISSVHEKSAHEEDQLNNVVKSSEHRPELAEIKEDEPTIDKPWGEGTEMRLDEKISEVVAQVDQMEAASAEVTEAEVDSLLSAAQQALLSHEDIQEETRINGASLLAEAEGELDESFREQVFEKLKKGFIKVRTAVADRNN